MGRWSDERWTIGIGVVGEETGDVCTVGTCEAWLTGSFEIILIRWPVMVDS